LATILRLKRSNAPLTPEELPDESAHTSSCGAIPAIHSHPQGVIRWVGNDIPAHAEDAAESIPIEHGGRFTKRFDLLLMEDEEKIGILRREVQVMKHRHRSCAGSADGLDKRKEFVLVSEIQ